MLKNKIFIIALLCIMAIPVYAIPEEETAVQQEAQSQTVNTLDEDNVAGADVAETSTEKLESDYFKKPVSKRRVAKKFLLAMFGVAASSLTIYLGLSLYNRFRYEKPSQTSDKETEISNSSLNTPETLSEAVKTFVDKTKWE